MSNLKDKEVLFIARNFFDYHIELKTALESKGAYVDMVFDVPFKSILLKALLRLFPLFISPISSFLIWRQIKGFSKINYDFIFVIIGEGVNRKFIKFLFSKYPHARKILYIWDGISNNRKPILKFHYLFDDVYSFDPVDCKKYGWNFLPLFCSRDSISNDPSFPLTYDFSFIGTAHSTRTPLLALFKKSLVNEKSIFIFQYLQSKILFYIYNFWDRRFRMVDITEINFTPLSRKEVNAIYKGSKVIIDIPHPKQVGLTIRAIQTLLSYKKLITTNKTIIMYKFYDPSNILIVDPKFINSYDFESFLATPSSIIPSEDIEFYFIDKWIDCIFHGNCCIHNFIKGDLHVFDNMI